MRKHGADPSRQAEGAPGVVVEGGPGAAGAQSTEKPAQAGAGRRLQDVCAQEAAITRMPLNVGGGQGRFWFPA